MAGAIPGMGNQQTRAADTCAEFMLFGSCVNMLCVFFLYVHYLRAATSKCHVRVHLWRVKPRHVWHVMCVHTLAFISFTLVNLAMSRGECGM